MRLWAIQLRVTYPPGGMTVAEPQIVIEADAAEEAQQMAKQWFYIGEGDVSSPVGIGVRTVVEINQENIWIFNDHRFRSCTITSLGRMN